MIRALTLFGALCFIGAIALIAADAEGNVVPALALVIVALMISGVLAIRSAYFKARTVAGDARAFATGRVQHARLVEIGDPRGIFTPESTITLELEGEDGKLHRIERDLPVPFPIAWGYRIGKRFKLPYFSGADLTDLMAFELRRDGVELDLDRRRSTARD